MNIIKIKDVILDISYEKVPVGVSPYIEIGDIDIINKTYSFKNKKSVSGAKYAEKNSIIVSTVRPTRGAISIIKEDKIAVSNAFAILKINDEICNYKYLFYMINNNRFFDYLGSISTGATYPTCSKDDVYNYEISLPSLQEQEKIVEIFDHVTHSIIFKKRQLESFDQMIKSIFSERFDRDEYELVRIGDYAKLQGGYAFKSKDFVDEGIKLIQISNVNKDDLDWKEVNRVPVEFMQKYKDYSLNENDVVMAMTRPIIKSLNEVKIATVSSKDLPCLLNQRVGRFIVTDKINKYYLMYCCKLDKFKKYVEKMSGNSLQPNISSKQVEDYEIKLPPMDEQNKFAEIVKQIEKNKKLIEYQLEMMTKMKESLLKEYFG